ncbi:hypothetical protein N7917_02725 [Bacillus sp. OR9]|nr:hypothetical protein [Bacillus sp. OR9]
MKETIRKVPNKGIGYFLLKYLRLTDKEGFIDNLSPEIGFNFMGDFELENMEDFDMLSKMKTKKLVQTIH